MPNIDLIIAELRAGHIIPQPDKWNFVPDTKFHNALKTLVSSARDARYLLELVGEVRAWVAKKRQQYQQDSAEQK